MKGKVIENIRQPPKAIGLTPILFFILVLGFIVNIFLCFIIIGFSSLFPAVAIPILVIMYFILKWIDERYFGLKEPKFNENIKGVYSINTNKILRHND